MCTFHVFVSIRFGGSMVWQHVVLDVNDWSLCQPSTVLYHQRKGPSALTNVAGVQILGAKV